MYAHYYHIRGHIIVQCNILNRKWSLRRCKLVVVTHYLLLLFFGIIVIRHR